MRWGRRGGPPLGTPWGGIPPIFIITAVTYRQGIEGQRASCRRCPCCACTRLQHGSTPRLDPLHWQER